YPGKKPKVTIPERTGWFLMIQHGDDVFLEQRPPVGLWGGLFCFPQFTSEQALTDWLAERGIHAKPQQLTAFRHTFSHFHLDIVPMWLAWPSAGSLMDEASGLWYNLAQPPSVGLAAPVERLLHELRHPQQLALHTRVIQEEE
ncbi:NUDIX domain-containing protein, partial [Serratia sp. Se-PFBMAAmG]|nr:NUDIX domain-containing protein [Serratia sp. Se-PFBMAAmG]